MAIPAVIQALIQAKLAQQGGAPGAAPSQFPSTDPTQVGAALAPVSAQAQQDQMSLAQQQQAAATEAFKMTLTKMAANANPMAWAAQGGPATPVSDVSAPADKSVSASGPAAY